jgi:hypothetical protein
MIGSLLWLVLLYFCLHILVARCVLYKWCYSLGVGTGVFGDIWVGVILGRTYFVRSSFQSFPFCLCLAVSVSLRTVLFVGFRLVWGLCVSLQPLLSCVSSCVSLN